MSPRRLLDGQPCADALADDRGLHFGDGVFETMAWTGEAIRFFDRHRARLTRGCEALGMLAPSAAQLAADLAVLDPGAERCVVKLVVTRGRAGHGYQEDPTAAPRRLWLVRDWPALAADDYRDGIDVAWLNLTLARQRALAGVKHLNRLEQVLAARELAATGSAEGLVCDTAGHVIEAVAANVFMVRDGRLLTPELSACGVAGVMREVLLATAANEGLKAREGVLRRADFAYADEVFICNAIRGIVPVCRLGDIRLADFTLSRRLSAALAEHGVTMCG